MLSKIPMRSMFASRDAESGGLQWFCGVCPHRVVNAGISSSKEIPATTLPQDAASATATAIRRVIMRYLIKTVIPGGGEKPNGADRTVSKRK